MSVLTGMAILPEGKCSTGEGLPKKHSFVEQFDTLPHQVGRPVNDDLSGRTLRVLFADQAWPQVQ